MKVREPAVAGQFYPGDPKSITNMIKGFLKNVPETKIEGKIRGIIVPHAGYEYSGQTAAYAFKQIADKEYDTIIIIGPSHQVPFKGIAIYPEGFFKTPLGNVEINSSLAKEIISQNKYINDMIEPHIPEHSLEVEIPFLQTVLKNFKIVPICMMDQSFEMCEILADAIFKSIKDKNILILASSDFYHGSDYNECDRSLKESISLISNYDIKGFHRAFNEHQSACGGGCITTCMLAAQKFGTKKATLAHSTNSGDVTGMKSGYIVGYASFILTNPGRVSLSKEDRNDLLEIARNSITNSVIGKPQKTKPPESQILMEKRGCFVTIKKKNELRGCIGYILPVKPLYQAVSEMAVEAALHDPRFPPVEVEEIPELKLEISILSPLQLVKSIDEIEIGSDGLYIKKGESSGILLPQVATEQGWGREEFLEQTCWKAGLQSDAWKDAKVYKFQAEIFGDEE